MCAVQEIYPASQEANTYMTLQHITLICEKGCLLINMVDISNDLIFLLSEATIQFYRLHYLPVFVCIETAD